MTSKRLCKRLITLVAILALSQFAFLDLASAGRGGVGYGGGRGGGHGGAGAGPGSPGRGSPGRGAPGRGAPGRGAPGRHGGFHHFHVGFRPRPLFWHPVGFFVATMAVTAIIVSANNRQYHYDQGVYYVETDGGYKATSAPIGAKIPDLPDDTQSVVVGGVTYYYYMGVFYKQGSDGYAVIEAPSGAMVSYLPDGNTTKTISGVTYYVYDGVYYQAKMVDGGTAYMVSSN
jgi:hypothetical protein